jgi:hypothetical protein
MPALIESVLREAAAMGKPFRERRRKVQESVDDDIHRLLGL